MPGVLVSHSKLRLRKGEAWRHCPRGPQYLPSCILRAIAALTRPAHKLSGSISLLPPELLHAIFELLAFSDHNTLSSCMRVCWLWHDVARLYFFAIVPSRPHGHRRLSQLFSADPRLAAYVKHVRFVWSYASHTWCQACQWQRPFDVQSLASILPVLGLNNLRYLSIVGYDVISLPRLHQSPTQWQRSLQRLSFDDCVGVIRILPDLLSLFSVHTLVIRIDPMSLTGPPSQQTIHHSIPLASLAIRDLVLDMTQGLEEYYRFFEPLLAPGSLRALSIGARTAQAFPKLAQFFRSGVAQDLRSLSIETWLLLFPYGRGAEEGTGFPSLGAALAHCTRLECFRIGFRHFWNIPDDPLCHHETFEPIIANLPPNLLAFAIHIGVTALQSWKRFRAGAVSLDVIDRLLSPSGGRFPHLRMAELHILHEVLPQWAICSKLVEEPRPTPLPRLKAAGLLQVNVVYNVELCRRRAEVYLPPEIQSLMTWMVSAFGIIPIQFY